MPKIYEYLGILIYFHSNGHLPIHVHATYNEFESKAEFTFKEGELVVITIKTVKGIKPLKGAKLNNFEMFLVTYSQQITQKWVDYFMMNKNIKFEKITKLLYIF